MRMGKIKSKRDVVMALQHNTRERIPVNSDPKKVGLNRALGGDTADCLRRFDSVMPDKVRKNAVLAVELVMTASPDFNGKWEDYLLECDKWALKTFGVDPKSSDLRPMIHAVHHYDEKTPHTHMIIVPVKDGKLNAKFFIGGSRDRMAELQNDFFETVGRPFKLERGLSRSETKARHTPHTLAGEAAELKEREKKLSVREEKFNEAVGDFKKLFGVKPADVNELKKNLANWENQSPAGLEAIAKNLRSEGARSAAHLRELKQRQEEYARKQGYVR